MNRKPVSATWRPSGRAWNFCFLGRDRAAASAGLKDVAGVSSLAPNILPVTHPSATQDQTERSCVIGHDWRPAGPGPSPSGTTPRCRILRSRLSMARAHERSPADPTQAKDLRVAKERRSESVPEGEGPGRGFGWPGDGRCVARLAWWKN